MNNYSIDDIDAEIAKRQQLAEIDAEIKKRQGENKLDNPSSQQPEQSAFNKYIIDPVHTDYDAIVEGLSRTGAGIGQLAYPPIDKALGTSLTKKLQNEMKSQDKYFQQRYGNDPYAKAIAFGAEVAPSIAGGVGTDAANAASLLGVLGKNAALGAGYGATSYDPSFKETGISGGLKKGAEGAVSGAAIGTPLSYLSRIPSVAAKLFTKMAGNTNPQELSQTMDAVKGLKTGIGDVINSPGLKTFQENAIGKIPLSGVEKTMGENYKQLIPEGKQILNQLNPNESDVSGGEIIQNSLKDIERKNQITKRDLYSDVDKIAQEKNVKVSGEKYINKANEITNELSNTTFSQDIDDSDINQLKSILNKIQSKKVSTNGKTGLIKDANITIGLLKDKAVDAHFNNKDYVSAKYFDLAHSLQNDLETSVKDSGSDELMASYDKAQKFYKDNIVPFEDKDIVRFTRRGGDSDTLVNYFIRPGKNDREKLLSKIVDKITPEQKNILAHSYLKQAYKPPKEGYDTELSPSELRNLYNKLGDRTKNKLFDKDTIDVLNRYRLRVNKNISGRDAMYNPKTGKQAADLAAMAATLGALGTGHLHEALLGAGLMGGANLTKRGLNSEALRKFYQKGYSKMPKAGKFQSGLAGLADSY